MVDALTLLAYMLDKMTWVIEGLTVNADQMLVNLELTRGVIYSQDVKLLLASRARERGLNITPETIYEYVQGCSFQAVKAGQSLIQVLADTQVCAEPAVCVSDLATPDELTALMDPWQKLRYLPRIFERFGIAMAVPSDVPLAEE